MRLLVDMNLSPDWVPLLGSRGWKAIHWTSLGKGNEPERDVRRRFIPSLVNFFRRYRPLADEALLFDAASHPPRLIARWAVGEKHVINRKTYEAIERQAKI
jgi:hypothetical protein